MINSTSYFEKKPNKKTINRNAKFNFDIIQAQINIIKLNFLQKQKMKVTT